MRGGLGMGMGIPALSDAGRTLDMLLAGLAGAQPSIAADLKSGQAWLRGAPYALTSLPGWAFTRALAAYGERLDGTLEPFVSGAPRLVNGRGLLVEGARTNLELYSQEFDNAAWTKTDITVSANNAAAPDGTTTADLITEGSAGTAIIRSASAVTVVAGSTYTTTRRVKRSANLQWLRLAVGNDTSFTNNVVGWFDIQNGVAGTLSGSTWTAIASDITAMADGYWRIRVTYSTAVNTALYVAMLSASTDGGTTRVSGAAYWAWGAQSELGAFPSSYIPTTSASVTRPADIPLIDISAYSPAITYPMTMYARFERVVDTGAIEAIFCLDDGDSTDRSRLDVNASDLAAIAVNAGGVSQASVTVAGALAVATAYRVAARINTNSVQIARSGTLGTEDTSVTLPASPTRVLLGQNSGTGNELFGYLSEFAIIPGGAVDANLQRLTT